MTIRHYQIPLDSDLKSYLKEAEDAVNAIADEDLERAEADLESRINSLAHPPVSIFSHRSSASSQAQSKPGTRAKALSLSRLQMASVSGFLMAALALLFIHQPIAQDQDHWQTKGSSDGAATVCEASTVRAGEAVLVTSNCANDSVLVLERLQHGQWQALENVSIVNRIVENKAGAIDFGSLSGESFRLRTERGVSEEFSLPTQPLKTP